METLPQSVTRRDCLHTAAKLLTVSVAGVLGLPVAVRASDVRIPEVAKKLGAPQQAAHLLNRLGYGPRPNDLALVADNPGAWLQAQLQPHTVLMPQALVARLAELPYLRRHPMHVVQEFRSIQQSQQAQQARLANASQAQVSSEGVAGRPPTSTPNVGGVADANQAINLPLGQFVSSMARPAIEARLARALESPRQLEEVMVDFWFNHFNVFQGKNILRVMMGHYEEYAIRPFAMGRFRDLLGATARHPAMLYYLDNASSVAPGSGGGPNGANRGLNENYARELMELHTLGVDGGYSQNDVTELARILTGWSILPANRVANVAETALPGELSQMPGFWFNERVHDRGEKNWLGHRVAAQGQSEGEFAMDVLARHPATARHLCFKLAQYFVSDQPSAALVGALSRVFETSHGSVVAVLSALFSHEAFWAPENVASKFKSPYHYVLSAVRATGRTPENLQGLGGALLAQGMPLYGCPTPDGYKNTQAAWLNPDAMTKRINFANQLSAARGTRGLTVEQVLQTLGPLVNEPTKAMVTDAQSDPPLALAMALAGPAMMHR
jgi:uncharacterized protein (DUF1800 family)